MATQPSARTERSNSVSSESGLRHRTSSAATGAPSSTSSVGGSPGPSSRVPAGSGGGGAEDKRAGHAKSAGKWQQAAAKSLHPQVPTYLPTVLRYVTFTLSHLYHNHCYCY
jgi:hypothetical protein